MNTVNRVPVPEADFQAAVIELAELQGWRVYHTHDSRGSQPGFPDLTMVRRHELIFAELKVLMTERATAEQAEWLTDLQRVAHHVIDATPGSGPPFIRVRLWRPSDWPEIEQVLKR